MDVMKKHWVALTIAVALSLGFGLSTSPALAESKLHGVTETAKEILVEVPRFCRPLKTVWTVQWEQTGNDEDALDAILASMQKEKGAKVTSHYLRRDALKLSALWRGGRTLHLPKFDAKGKPIKVKLVSIVAFGEEFIDLSPNNWGYASQNSRWVDGASISPPVRAGVWGKCV